jgi:polyhydroxyalkanoate synthesis regulator phasin
MGKVTIDDLAVMMKNGFERLEDKIETEIASVRQDLKTEIASVRSDIARLQCDIDDIKARLVRLEKRTLEDADALAKEVVDLRKRVDYLEKELSRLKLQKA